VGKFEASIKRPKAKSAPAVGALPRTPLGALPRTPLGAPLQARATALAMAWGRAPPRYCTLKPPLAKFEDFFLHFFYNFGYFWMSIAQFFGYSRETFA